MTIDLQIGDFVRCGFFVGRIEDIATSERRVMLLIHSPKGVWRNHGPEWIEYDPEAVTKVSGEEYNVEVDRYRERVQETLKQLEGMRLEEPAAAD